jgi:hypothetical protein
MSHLPSWVQVTDASTTLFAADTGKATSEDDANEATLQRFTFLDVLGAGSARLHVRVIDPASGQATLDGWVNPDAVAPAAAGQGWLVAATPTTLYASADADAPGRRGLDAFTALQQLDGPVQGRVQVLVFSSDFSSVVDAGWVALADTGPALPPLTRVPSAQDTGAAGERGPLTADQRQRFLNLAGGAARTSATRTGVPASITVAQAILESDWGRSGLAQSASNYFGVKALGGLGDDGVVWMPTAEYTPGGQLYQTVSAFRAYKSLSDSILDHDQLLARLDRYAPAMQVATDPRQFAHLLVQGGYATDPAYADKLISLMDQYNLYQLDT